MHIKEICQRGEECADPECCKRHPRRCRYFYKYGNCKLGEKCAYRHDEETKETKIKTLEMEVKHLKEEMNNLKSEMNKIVKMLKVEEEVDIHGKKDGKEKKYEKETVEEKKDTSKESEIKRKDNESVWFKCDVCDYKAKKKVTLQKHMNSKHCNTASKAEDTQKETKTTENVDTRDCSKCESTDSCEKRLCVFEANKDKCRWCKNLSIEAFCHKILQGGLQG